MSKRYTVNQLATITGVSARTLHHYDLIGLLVPAYVGDNGYRYYGAAEMLRLQQILLHREFGMQLKDIRVLLDQNSADRIDQLQEQKSKLMAEVARYRSLIQMIDRTIVSLTGLGEFTMKHAGLYKAITPEKQNEYAEEIALLYGKDVVKQSVATFNGMSVTQRQTLMDELAEIELSVASLMRQGVASHDIRVAPLIERHRAWVATMWGRPCPYQAHAGLADIYINSSDFRARFESIGEGMTDYFSAAIQAVANGQPEPLVRSTKN